VLAVLATACIHRPPLMKLDVPTPIAMVVVLDQKDGAVLDREPRELRRQLVRQLEKRNLVLERLTPEQLAPLSRSIDTKTRLDLIAQALGPGKLFLLVELRVALDFSDLDGAYKWSVDSHLSVSSTDSLATANSTDFGTSVFLHQEFDREREVLRQASEDLADRVGILLDSHFAGRAGTQGGAPPPPVPPAEPPAPGEPLVAPPAEAPPAAPPSPPSTRADWASKPLYFVLLDRFAPDEGTAADVNRADPDDWHGGTLATLRRHLDDLQALGVGSVWLSPVSSCRELKLGVFGPSHCYWVKDLGTIERRFGSLAELRSLRDELHARGMRLVLDIVLNHVSPDSPLMKEHPDWLHPRLAIRDFDDPVQLEKGWLGGLAGPRAGEARGGRLPDRHHAATHRRDPARRAAARRGETHPAHVLGALLARGALRQARLVAHRRGPRRRPDAAGSGHARGRLRRALRLPAAFGHPGRGL
jgi:hypothetical protein